MVQYTMLLTAIVCAVLLRVSLDHFNVLVKVANALSKYHDTMRKFSVRIPHGLNHINSTVLHISAQNANANSAQSIGDDQANWQALWTAMSTMSDSRSDVADSTRLSLFDIILRANVQARRKCDLETYG